MTKDAKRPRRHKRIVRFLIVALCVTGVVYFFLPVVEAMFNFGDSDLPPYQPDTTFERVFERLWLLGLLPLAVGLFSAFVIDLLFIAKRHLNR
jgi:hypothetical protein